MPRRARAPLQQAAINREAPLIIVQVRHHLAQLRHGQQLRIIALVSDGIGPANGRVPLPIAVKQANLPTLGMHNIVIEIRLQPFPKLQGMRIKFRVPRQEVIGPNDGCIPSNIAAANIAFLQHGNAPQPMFFCQVVSC